MGIFDLIFPKFCIRCKKIGNYICDSCFSYISFDTKERCLVCNKPAIGGKTHPFCVTKYSINGSFSAVVYKGVIKKAVYQFKYKPYITALEKILCDLLYESLIQKEGFYAILEKKPFIVGIPLHSTKLTQRGYNHADLLATGLAMRLALPVYDVLIRTKQTRPQYGLSSKERKDNIAGAFSVTTNSLTIIKGKTIFLVDDIITTGTTVQEAAKVLRRAGAGEVFALALAQDE